MLYYEYKGKILVDRCPIETFGHDKKEKNHTTEKYKKNSQAVVENLQKIANSIDDKIDNFVYKLYNLTEEEIKIIETNL